MYCRICATHRTVSFRRACRMNLCDHCASETPRKASRANFDRAYWGAKFATVPESTRREFFNDYKVSCCTLAEYKEKTTGDLYYL